MSAPPRPQPGPQPGPLARPRSSPPTRTVTVRQPGGACTVQDSGRPGFAHLGVPVAGWLDAGSARLANRLVGNLPHPGPDGAEAPGTAEHALLECVGGGLVCEVSAATTLAVTGARCGVRVDGVAVAFAHPVTVRAGATVELGPVEDGIRVYVAFAGGVLTPPVLRSRSTDSLSGLGGAVLEPGARLELGAPVGPPGVADAVPVPRWGSVAVLTCHLGPRADWFTEEARQRLASASYVVGQHADRVGIRLSGPALERSRTEELPSEGLVTGAVQVPADGQPLIFLNDHPTTGGYPVLAVVAREDLDRCGQLRPGDTVSFRVRPAP